MTLMEVLVAMMIFTVVFLAALGLYQVANRAYLRTDAATIQQQNVRFAMDRLAETMRDSGANYNTLGALNLADEQIEGAWDAAIFVRGDFDNSRETALESTAFPIVTTGNDEIVGYVLRKPGGDANNTVALTMKMDFSAPRDATNSGGTITGEETATVQVATSSVAGETDPPYQLARVTFNSAGAPQYEVVAENIFRLSFGYLDKNGAAAIPTVGGDDAQRTDRAAVRQIDVNLVGMSSRPDPGYTDPNTYTPAEGTSTKNLRKLSLTQHIVPPNLGLVGHRHMSSPAIVIQPPASITVCTGHCQYFGVTWPASSSAGVTTYKLHITAPASGPDLAVDETQTVTGLSYDYHQPTATSRAFTFTVAATTITADSVYTAAVTATASNDAASVPSVPTVVVGAQDSSGANAMLVNWNAVTTNTGNITAATCISSAGGNTPPPSPWNNTPFDLSYYKVFRVRSDGIVTGGFTAGVTNRVDNQVSGPLINVTPSGAYSSGGNSRGAFTDHTAAPCSSYFYQVQAFDYCNVGSTSSAAMASAVSYDLQPATIMPDVPGGTAGAANAVTGTTTSSAGNYNVTINWPAVYQTATGAPAGTAHYKIDRYRKVAPASTYSFDATQDVYEATTFSEAVPTTLAGNAITYQYYVRAAYDCATPRASTQAGPYTATCTPAGTMVISTPGAGTDIDRPSGTSLTPTLTTTGSGWTSATVTITGPNPSLATLYSQTISGAPVSNVYTFPAWDSSPYPDGTYTISATATAGGCTTPAQTQTFTLSTFNCGLQLAATPVYQGNGSNSFMAMTFQITNTCTTTALTVSSLQFTWSGVSATRWITSIQVASTTVATGLTSTTGANGVAITLSPAQAIAGGATSATYTLNFNNNFTDDGSFRGNGGKFSSIVAHETSPAVANDEMIVGPPVP